MKITPIGERLIVKPIKEAEKTKAGIFIPETAAVKPFRAEVVSLGELENDKEWPFAVGDTIMFNAGAGTDIIEDEKPYLLLNLRDVLLKY